MSTTTPPALSPVQVWLLAARPRTLPASVAPVLVGAGAAFHDQAFALGPALAALVGAMLLQITSNFANDYFDHLKGADTEARIGPMRVTQAGLVTPAQIQLAIALTIALTLVVGAYLIAVGGWPIALLGLASIACALAYTGGPFPLAYHGLGELAVFLFFGPAAVVGAYWVQAQAVSPLAVALALPLGLWAAAILVVNNLRDADTDADCGKRTLAVRFGRPFMRHLYAGLIGVGFATIAALGLLGPHGLLLGLAGLPLAVPPLRAVFGPPEGPALNGALAGTARMLAVTAALTAAGLLL
ncbi:MAG: 1,4-dihydroxy-2-naphthoate polyprenyltransferase [Candidatus Sericytochromatia bacterium]